MALFSTLSVSNLFAIHVRSCALSSRWTTIRQSWRRRLRLGCCMWWRRRRGCTMKFKKRNASTCLGRGTSRRTRFWICKLVHVLIWVILKCFYFWPSRQNKMSDCYVVRVRWSVGRLSNGLMPLCFFPKDYVLRYSDIIHIYDLSVYRFAYGFNGIVIIVWSILLDCCIESNGRRSPEVQRGLPNLRPGHWHHQARAACEELLHRRRREGLLGWVAPAVSWAARCNPVTVGCPDLTARWMRSPSNRPHLVFVLFASWTAPFWKQWPQDGRQSRPIRGLRHTFLFYVHSTLSFWIRNVLRNTSEPFIYSSALSILRVHCLCSLCLTWLPVV